MARFGKNQAHLSSRDERKQVQCGHTRHDPYDFLQPFSRLDPHTPDKGENGDCSGREPKGTKEDRVGEMQLLFPK